MFRLQFTVEGVNAFELYHCIIASNFCHLSFPTMKYQIIEYKAAGKAKECSSVIYRQVMEMGGPVSPRDYITTFSSILDPDTKSIMMLFRSCLHEEKGKEVDGYVRAHIVGGALFTEVNEKKVVFTEVVNLRMGGFLGALGSLVTQFSWKSWSSSTHDGIVASVNHYLKDVKPTLKAEETMKPVDYTFCLPGFKDDFYFVKALLDNVNNQFKINLTV